MRRSSLVNEMFCLTSNIGPEVFGSVSTPIQDIRSDFCRFYAMHYILRRNCNYFCCEQTEWKEKNLILNDPIVIKNIVKTIKCIRPGERK